MAVINAGILSQVSGKVAGVVGGSWKGTNYLREYVIPSNPNTTAQQTQRTKFTDAVSFGKLILGQILNVYVDVFQKSMSGFNYFIQQNITKFPITTNWASLKITFGKLYFGGISNAVVSAGSVAITTSQSLGSNGSASDKVFACAYVPDAGLMYFASAAVLRSAGTITVSGSGISVTTSVTVYAFAAAYDTNGVLTSVSDSSGYNITVG